MGASSVTGTGIGSAFPGQKGPGNNRNVFVPSVNPHVIAAGRIALVAGSITITLPKPLAGSHAKYVILVTGETSAAAYVSTRTNNSDGDFASFVITGTGTATVNWMITRVGFGLDL